MRTIVTGASGYIGGQTILQLLDQGHEVYGIDRRPLPANLKSVLDKFLLQDFSSDTALQWIRHYQPDAIIHCAGTSLVGPSMMTPSEYYDNNFVKTKRLCDWILGCTHRPRFIFSSSAATYGDPVMTPCSELDPPLPMSPYGQSKLMVDWMLESYHNAYDLDYVSFRYFNACGADPQARHGQEPGATHIIARVLESIRDGKDFTLYGDNYPTPDGTCIRDYVHVDDLARAHAMAMDTNVPVGVYNLGTSSGHSNKEIVALSEKVTGQQVDLRKGSIRAGDPAVLTASADKFNNTTGWMPRYNIEEIITHVWAWYNK
jgi:UDP-glucose-4-epimerase GalE